MYVRLKTKALEGLERARALVFNLSKVLGRSTLFRSVRHPPQLHPGAPGRAGGGAIGPDYARPGFGTIEVTILDGGRGAGTSPT
jgi:hypothetical protein